MFEQQKLVADATGTSVLYERSLKVEPFRVGHQAQATDF
jgi:hypothetical protein